MVETGKRNCATVCLVILTVCARPAFCEPVPSGELAPKETLRVNKDRYWYLIVGVANDWPRLGESEAEIDRNVNRFLGSFLPNWRRPETLKDWRDDFKLWDFHVGLGRSLSDRWSLFVVVGGVAGGVRDRNRYLFFGVPLEVASKFERRLLYLSTGADFYPWGKASLEDSKKGNNWLTRRLFAAKPYVQAAGGYSNMYTVGQVKVSIPGLGSIGKGKHAEYYDIFFLSPRLGMDIPLNNTDHLSFMAGYIFYMRHPDEFNTASFFISYKHRF